MATSRAREPGGDAAGWVEVGRVVRPHGLDGALLVQLHGDDPGNLLRSDRVQLSAPDRAAVLEVARAHPAGSRGSCGARARLWLAGLGDRTAAVAWAKAAVAIPASALAALPAGEFYWRELLGASCRTVRGRRLGVLEGIWPTGGNDVLEIRSGTTRHLIPALRQLLVRLDRESGVLWLDPPDWMLEDE